MIVTRNKCKCSNSSNDNNYLSSKKINWVLCVCDFCFAHFFFRAVYEILILRSTGQNDLISLFLNKALCFSGKSVLWEHTDSCSYGACHTSFYLYNFHSLTHSLTHSLIHSLTHSFTHSLTHSLTHYVFSINSVKVTFSTHSWYLQRLHCNIFTFFSVGVSTFSFEIRLLYLSQFSFPGLQYFY